MDQRNDIKYFSILPIMKPYRKIIIWVVLSILSYASTALCGQVYKWVDKNGVTHFTDSLTDSSVIENYDVEHYETRDDDRDFSYVPEQDREEGELSLIRNVLTEYHRTHTYSMPDFFVCSDMAIEVWNILKTKGIRSVIYAGIVDKSVNWKGNLDYLKKMNHAWVLAEFAPSSWIALETTGGYLVYSEEMWAELGVVKNGRYYRGFRFHNPRELKDFMRLRKNFFKVCYEAVLMVHNWNSRFAGKRPTYNSVWFKGRKDIKVEECNESLFQLMAFLKDKS